MYDTKIDSLYTYYYFKKKVKENHFTLEVLAMLAREALQCLNPIARITKLYSKNNKNFILFPLENEVLYYIIFHALFQFYVKIM